MFYIYILFSQKDQKLYYGRTNNLVRRLSQHNKGKVSVTKSRKPFILIYYEAYKIEKDAIIREKKIKSRSERERIKKQLKNTIDKYKGSVA